MFKKLLSVIGAICLLVIVTHAILTHTTPTHVRKANAPVLAYVQTVETDLSDILYHQPLTANDARAVYAINQHQMRLQRAAHDDRIGIRVAPPALDDITENINAVAHLPSDTAAYDRAGKIAETETLLKRYSRDIRRDVDQEVNKWGVFNITLGLMAVAFAFGLLTLGWRDDT